MELQDLAEEYQGKTDEELLRLALDPAQLTPEASSVLNGELARRRINSAERLKAFRDEEEQGKEEQGKDTGKLFVVHPYGIGRKRFGKAGRMYDPETGMERFKTTVNRCPTLDWHLCKFLSNIQAVHNPLPIRSAVDEAPSITMRSATLLKSLNLPTRLVGLVRFLGRSPGRVRVGLAASSTPLPSGSHWVRL